MHLTLLGALIPRHLHFASSQGQVENQKMTSGREVQESEGMSCGYAPTSGGLAGQLGHLWQSLVGNKLDLVKTMLWFSSVQFTLSVVSGSLWSHGLQHTRPPCPSPTPGAYSNSYPFSQWCHPTISYSVIPFSSAFNLSQHQGLFQWVSSSHQVVKVLVSASASVLPMNIQDWFP